MRSRPGAGGWGDRAAGARLSKMIKVGPVAMDAIVSGRYDWRAGRLTAKRAAEDEPRRSKRQRGARYDPAYDDGG